MTEQVPSLQKLLQVIGFNKFEVQQQGYWGHQRRFYLETNYEKIGPYADLEDLRQELWQKLAYVYRDRTRLRESND